MQRRDFVKKVVGSGVATSIYRTTTCDRSNTIEVKLFQTRRLHELQKDAHNSPTYIQESIKEELTEALSAITDREIDLLLSTETVRNVTENPLDQDQIPLRFLYNALWTSSGSIIDDLNTAKHSNVLLDVAEGDLTSRERFGIGSLGILPSCITNIDSFASVFLGERLIGNDSLGSMEDRAVGIILHEIGHTLGLQHDHGTVVKRYGIQHRSVMCSRSFAANNSVNRYGTKIPDSEMPQACEFNEKISDADLIL